MSDEITSEYGGTYFELGDFASNPSGILSKYYPGDDPTLDFIVYGPEACYLKIEIFPNSDKIFFLSNPKKDSFTNVWSNGAVSYNLLNSVNNIVPDG